MDLICLGQFQRNAFYRVETKSISTFYMFVVILIVLQPLIGPVAQFLNERHSFRYWGSRVLPRSLYDYPPIIAAFVLYELLMSNICSTLVAYTGLILHLYTFLTASWVDFFRQVSFLNFEASEIQEV